MPEERKEKWTTLVRKGDNSGYNLRRARKITEVYDDISLYTPKYLPAGSMEYDSKTLLYTLTKPIKVRNSDGSFTVYDVPEFAVKGVYISLVKPKVEPIADLATLNNQLTAVLPLNVSNPVPPKSNTVVKLQALKPVTQKSNSIVKLPVPLNLLPYIANVTSDGVAFFNIPDGYTLDLFDEAIKAVFLLNKELAQKPMVYYKQPQLLILQLKQQLLAALLSLRLYYTQRLQTALKLDIKYTTNGLTKTVEVPVKKTDTNLVTEAFAYPSRTVYVYNIHPEAYLKVLEYLNNNFDKTKTRNKPEKYVLSFSGFEKVPIGGEVNDSVFHYIDKNGKDLIASRIRIDNANIIKENESIFDRCIYGDVVTDNGKLKLYLNSDNNEIYYKDVNGYLVSDPFKLYTMSAVGEDLYGKYTVELPEFGELDLTKQLIADYVNKYKNILLELEEHDIDRSIFHPIEKELTTLNNSTLLTSNSGNVVLKVKQTVKLTASKIRNFLGFLNGGQLKYYNNGKQIRIK